VSAALLAAAAAAALCAGLGAALVRSRARARQLRTRLGEALEQLERLEHSFRRLAPHPLVEKVIASDGAAAGESRQVTVIFADIAGFTSLSEKLEPAVLVRVLNGYFDRMNRAIGEHRGQISTFLGDGLLALFGAFEHNPWQGNDALHAALAMRAALADYNRELAAQALPPLAIGIGVHRGVGVAGLVGSRERTEFAVVGGIVNVAARVQAHTRVLGVDVLATGAACEAADPRFVLRALPPAALRGIERPVSIFAVEGFGDAPRA
jgi:adenylate cyclase